jgi:hypothetical protein
MKSLLIPLLLLVSFSGISQTKQKPHCYLNEKEIDLDCVFINPDNIESMHVEKKKPEGEVFIVTKEKPWRYKSIDKLIRTADTDSQSNEKSAINIYIIDGKLVKDKSEIRIDDSYFAKVTWNRLSDVSGIEGDCSKLVLVDIRLSKTDPGKVIYIRGNESSFPDTLSADQKKLP